MKTPLLAFLTTLLLIHFSLPTQAQSVPSKDSGSEGKSAPQKTYPETYQLLNLGVSLGAGAALGFTQTEEDKRYHYWAGYGITTLGTWGLNRAGMPKLWASVSGLALGVLAGYVKEEYDRSRGKPFDQRDWNATNLGAASAVAIINIPW